MKKTVVQLVQMENRERTVFQDRTKQYFRQIMLKDSGRKVGKFDSQKLRDDDGEGTREGRLESDSPIFLHGFLPRQRLKVTEPVSLCCAKSRALRDKNLICCSSKHDRFVSRRK